MTTTITKTNPITGTFKGTYQNQKTIAAIKLAESVINLPKCSAMSSSNSHKQENENIFRELGLDKIN